MLSMNRSKAARLVVGAVLAAAAVAAQSSDAVARKRLTIAVSKTRTDCNINPSGVPFYGWGKGMDGFGSQICNVASTGGTAFNDSDACQSGFVDRHQPFLVTQSNGAGNPVVQPGCTGGLQLSWTTAQPLTCSVPAGTNCPSGNTFTIITQGQNN
jgi:hypothetical protein